MVAKTVVIVGTGQAGVQAAFSLRDEGFEGRIVLVGEEAGLPYQRPPLSKAYLLGKLDDEGVLLKASQLYQDYRIELLDGVRAERIDREARRLELSSGDSLAYDHLVLATGSRQRRIDAPGSDLAGVLALRTLSDAKALASRLDAAERVVVVGAGFIGLEFASVARAKGLDVTVVELAQAPMTRVLSAEMSRFFHAHHVAAGVRFRFGVGVAAFEGGDRLSAVELTDGCRLKAEFALVGAGAVPDVALARSAGLETADGVLVDETMRTSDPAIYAVGDCARHPNPFSAGGSARLESVQNATDQARCAAAAIVGLARPFDAVPWFWSDQGELKLQIAGIGTGHDLAVVRGDPKSAAFSVFCFRGGRLLAVESVNRGPDHVLARRLLAAGCSLSHAEAADQSLPLKSFLLSGRAIA
jgi:3-phenylpropionate/trans-cinnamate dioxygenase ferredoxin reductase subunit